MFVCCKNVEVNKQNEKRLNEIKEGVVEVQAINVHPTIKDFKPSLGKKGEVKKHTFPSNPPVKKEFKSSADLQH